MYTDSYKENAERANLREAVISSLDSKASIDICLREVEQLEEEREDARARGEVFLDEDELPDSYHDERLNYPSTAGLNLKQVEAIYLKECESRSIDPYSD